MYKPVTRTQKSQTKICIKVQAVMNVYLCLDKICIKAESYRISHLMRVTSSNRRERWREKQIFSLSKKFGQRRPNTDKSTSEPVGSDESNPQEKEFLSTRLHSPPNQISKPSREKESRVQKRA